MKKLKKIELATCDVVEMNPQELQNADGGDIWDIAFGTFDYAIRDMTGGRENGYSCLASIFIPGYGLYNSISTLVNYW